MTAGDYAALSDFELPRVDHGKRVIAFFDNCPLLCTTGYSFAEIARVPRWEFQHYSCP